MLAILYLVLTPFLVRLASAAQNNSIPYEDGVLGNAPESPSFSGHYWPVFNYRTPPTTTSQEGYIFLAPRGVNVTNHGAYIISWDGQLVWDGSEYGETMAFSKQTYLGNEVLALWQGNFSAGGYGYGKQLILDQSYNIVVSVTTTLADQNVTNDFHEFQITPNDTALIDMYITKQYGLAAYNVTGSSGGQGWIITGAAQEIDIQTGQASWTWNSLDHVDPAQSYVTPGGTGASQDNAWDYFHLNSIDKDSKCNFLISSRHCRALYYVSGQNGSVIWTIGGRNSSFNMGDGTTFAWQHDARWQSNETQISLFDNGATDWETAEPTARGLVLNIHPGNMSITVASEFLSPTTNASVSQGSMELQPNRNWLIGWGSQPWVSEFAPNGTELWTFQYALNNVSSYRALRAAWSGYPHTAADLDYQSSLGPEDGFGVLLSWNAATEVAYWLLYASSTTDGSDLNSVAHGPDPVGRAPFETRIEVRNSAVAGKDYLQGAAYSGNGTLLGYTAFWSILRRCPFPRLQMKVRR